MIRFSVGDLVTISNTFKVAGVATDPTTVSLVVTNPAGTAVAYTYAGGSITKSGVGVYTKDISADQVGTWVYRWVGTGDAADVQDGTFDVSALAAVTDVVTLEQVKSSLNMSATDTSHDAELQLYIDAVTEYIEARVGTLASAEYTETATVTSDGYVLTRRWPVLSIVSVEDDYGTSYTADFTIRDGAWSFEHESVTSGEWTITYTAGFARVPADLKLAVLEDLRGLYQPGQIGPAAEFGAFGVESTDVGVTYRPVRLWPRVDAWLENRYGPVIA